MGHVTHAMEMLCSIAFLLIELKVFSALIKSTTSTSFCWYKSNIAWMAVSVPASCPAQTCSAPLVCWRSFLGTCNTIFLDIWCNTSSTPIGWSPGFFLVELVNLLWTPLNYFRNHYLLYACLWCKCFNEICKSFSSI